MISFIEQHPYFATILIIYLIGCAYQFFDCLNRWWNDKGNNVKWDVFDYLASLIFIAMSWCGMYIYQRTKYLYNKNMKHGRG